jgi:hypothetical protein
VHEQPEATDEEQEQGPDRLRDEDAMRGPGHDDPHEAIRENEDEDEPES